MSWELGISTGIAYRHPIGEVLAAIARTGLQAIEVSTAPRHLPLEHPGQMQELRRTIVDLGLRVHSLHAPFGHDVNLTSPDASQRAAAMWRLTQAADALVTLGGGLYVIHPGGEDQRWVWEREQRLALSVEGLTRVAEVCRQRGLELVVETPLPHLLGGLPEDFFWILERLPDDTRVCLDTSHTALGGSLFDFVQRLAGRLVHVQASDNKGVSDDHLPPGDGAIDWPRVLLALEHARYAGVFMLEVSGNGDPGAHVRNAVAAGRRVLAAFTPH